MKETTNNRIYFLFLILAAVTILSGCITPFGSRSTDIDWDAKTKPGTITVSDAKQYRREALIDERRKDVEWINELIEKSKTIEFKPEILREIEIITAFSAALGLKFDPASAVSYQRSNETGELKQQIDTMKLQLQLDQLKRDAELVRSRFDIQTEPVNSDLAKLTSDSSQSSINSLSAADQLKAAIDRLTVATYDFNKEVKGTTRATTAISPLDDFRDRQAYRDLLKAARNAASLDELHDWNGSTLLRLNFEATVIPYDDNSSAPGVIQMRVVPPKRGSVEANHFYRNWIDYLNRRLNIDINGELKPDPEFLKSTITNNFEIVHYLYAHDTRVPSTNQCYGFKTTEELRKYPSCKSLIFFAPQLKNTTPGGKGYMRFTDDINLMLNDSDDSEIRKDLKYRQLIKDYGDSLVKKCSYVDAKDKILPKSKELQQALSNAKDRLAIGDYYIALEGIAQVVLRTSHIEPPVNNDLEKVKNRTARAGLLTATFLETLMDDCNADERKSFDGDTPTIYVTPMTDQLFWGDKARVAIYEVGPREQVQQMSTAARSASSLGLALSIAASVPSYGVAAQAAAAYSRQAMGRAEALERLPSVVGYSVSNLKTFGWVLGPRATVDPKGKINLEQTIRPLDLTVDLSVPGWWPSFTLEILTAWAPDRIQMVEGNIVPEQNKKYQDGKKNSLPNFLRETPPLPMTVTSTDYENFTKLLTTEGIELRRRDEKLPVDKAFATQKVSACHPSTIVLRGDFLWRATTVIVGGVKLSGGSISILPDMRGIMVDVPAFDEKIIGNDAKLQVSVLTPYGPGITEVSYDKPMSGCKKTEAKVDPDAPSISDYNPKSFQLPGLVTISVEGGKLKKVKEVRLNGIPGKIVSQEDKKLVVEFSEDKTKILRPENAVSLSFLYEDAKNMMKTIEKTVAIVANVGGK